MDPDLQVNGPRPTEGPVLALPRKYIWPAVVMLVVIIIGFGLIWLMGPVGRSSTMVKCSIATGSSAVAIGQQLAACGLIRSPWFFAVYVRLSGQAGELKAGTYEISPAMSLRQIADAIASGKALSTDIVVTIPEGMNLWEIDKILASSGLPIRAGQFSSVYKSQEGRLFPETYRFAKDATAADVARAMSAEFQQRADGVTSSRLVIASILEKEAKTAQDMALVSGIIQKRLSLGMPLQIDATVAYGWCLRTTRAGSDCDVTQAPLVTEIKIDGPYNTYTRKGLPAGSIANPGTQAIYAAEHPQSSDYLYYLSTRDGSQIIYAKTLAEQLANRKKYLGF